MSARVETLCAELSLTAVAHQYANLADVAVDALERFFADVRSGAFPGDEETYHMPEESAQILRELSEQAGGLGGAGIPTDSFLADEAMEQ